MNSEQVEKILAEFASDFQQKFGDKPVLKTPFHFLNFVAKGDEVERNRLVNGFDAYSRKAGTAKTVQNAAQWWCHGRVEK